MVEASDILKARQDRELTQAEFAKFFGVDQSTIQRWETNGVPARGMTAVAVQSVLAKLPPVPSEQERA